MSTKDDTALYVRAAVAADIELNQPIGNEMAAAIAAHRRVSERTVLGRAAASGYADMNAPRLIYHPAPEQRIQEALSKLQAGKEAIDRAPPPAMPGGGSNRLMVWIYAALIFFVLSFSVFYCAVQSPVSDADRSCNGMGGTAVGNECRF